MTEVTNAIRLVESQPNDAQMTARLALSRRPIAQPTRGATGGASRAALRRARPGCGG